MTAPRRRHGPDAGHAEAANHTHRICNSNALAPYRVLAGQPSSRPIKTLLARLDRVRQYGKGWRCDCPFGHSSHGALSVAEGDDGRVLIRCFAGCSIADVLGAVGLQLTDLFPERVRDLSPMARAQRREASRAADWAAALGVLAHEANVVRVCAGMILLGETLSNADRERLTLAGARIDHCRELLT